jgi:hypothetical protein
MDAVSFASLDFPVAWCDQCGREVLTHTEVLDDGADSRMCVHCDSPIYSDSLRTVRGTELAGRGYEVVEEQPRSCGSGGCGSGGCGRR